MASGLEGRHSLTYFLRAAGRSPARILKLRDSGPSGCPHCFTCPGLHPIGLPLGRRSSPSYRTWEEHGWCTDGVWWWPVHSTCVRVRGMNPN